MKNLKILLPVAMLCACLLCTCRKDNCGNKPDEYYYYNISDDAKAKIPFTGKDTLVYISDDGDTAILYGRVHGYKKETMKDLSGNSDCPRYRHDIFEHIDYAFTGINDTLYDIKYFLSIEGTGFEINGNWAGGAYAYQANDESLYKDSVKIDGTYYMGIYMNFKNNVSCVYSYHYGFLKIQLSSGRTYLLNIK